MEVINLYRMEFYLALLIKNDPNGSRTRVAAVKGQCPRPLDDGVISSIGAILYSFFKNCQENSSIRVTFQKNNQFFLFLYQFFLFISSIILCKLFYYNKINPYPVSRVYSNQKLMNNQDIRFTADLRWEVYVKEWNTAYYLV